MKFEVMCLALLGPLFFCSRVSALTDVLTELLNQKLSPQWNEDLEPELEKIMKRVRKETLPIVNEIISDEAMNADCLQTLTRIVKGMTEYKLWAMKFLDSTGGLVPNMVEGRSTSLGSYDECLSIRIPNEEDPAIVDASGKYCTLSVRMLRQPMLYRVIPKLIEDDSLLLHYFGNNNTMVVELMEKIPLGFRLGVCLPSTCPSTIVTHMVDKFLGKFGVSAEVLSCRDPLEETITSTGTYISGVTLIVLVAIVSAATASDFYSDPNNKAQSIRLVRCFSAKQSFLKLTNTETNFEAQHLDCIHGIRVLSCLWILWGHTFGGDPGRYDRPSHLFEMLQSPVFSLIPQGVLAVETFFTLTGILLYRIVLAERRKTKSPALVFALFLVFRRAIRLIAPAMGTLVFLYMVPLITSGPGMDAFFQTRVAAQCDSRWWMVPLFLNNLWQFDELCLPHLWYLAADMQLLCIFLFPVILMVSKPKKGLTVTALLGLLGVCYTAYIFLAYDAAPSIMLIPRQIMKSVNYALHLHVQSLSHVSAVCVGVIGGYLIEHHRHMKFPRAFFALGWIAAAIVSNVILFAVIIWQRSGTITTLESIVYGTTYRPIWAVCVVWTVYACAAGGGQALRWCLNRSTLVIMGRLTYCFYLISLLTTLIKNFSATSVVPFTNVQNFRDAIADMVITYLAAFLMYLLFEAPAHALDKFVNGSVKKQTPSCDGEKSHAALGIVTIEKPAQEVKPCVLP